MGALTWGEMRNLLISEHGVSEDSILVSISGNEERMVYLRRSEGVNRFVHPYPILMESDEFLTPQMIRNICKGLNLSPKPFGLPLG
jgi:hypothetical protein